jgi:hypothetical protein
LVRVLFFRESVSLRDALSSGKFKQLGKFLDLAMQFQIAMREGTKEFTIEITKNIYSID